MDEKPTPYTGQDKSPHSVSKKKIRMEHARKQGTKFDQSEASREGIVIALIFMHQALIKYISHSGSNPGKESEWEAGVLGESYASSTVEITRSHAAGAL